MGKIFAGVKQVLNDESPNCIVLRNFGNVPANFHWDEKLVQGPGSMPHIKATFEPPRGTIPPKSDIPIYFQFTVFTGGNMCEMFTCEIDDIELPLGFQLVADVFGLSVTYEQPDEVQRKTHTSLGDSLQEMLPGSMYSTQDRERYTESVMKGMQEKPADQKGLSILSFPMCTINKPSTQKFVLKNLSGIKTTFSFRAIKYEPSNSATQNQMRGALPPPREEPDDQTHETAGPSSYAGGSRESKKDVKIRFAPGVKSGGTTRFGKFKEEKKKIKDKDFGELKI